MITQACLQRLSAILCWVMRLHNRQDTLPPEDVERLHTKSETRPSLKCCVCFERKAPPRTPCSHCGSSIPLCERCLRSWSLTVGSIRSCVVCRSEGHEQITRPSYIDSKQFFPGPPLRFCCIMLYTLVCIFLQTCWIIFCYEVVTTILRERLSIRILF